MLVTLAANRGRAMVNRGKTVCANNWRESQEVLDRKVIGAIERTILTPEAVSRVVERALQLAKERRKQEPDTTKKVEAEIKLRTRERDNLVAACAQGRAPESVLFEIHNREHHIARLKDELARSPHRMQVEDGELEKLKQAIIGRMGKFHGLVYADVPLARQALRKLLAGPIKCTPAVRDGRRDYAIRGEAKLENLLPGASVTLVPWIRRRPYGVDDPVGTAARGVALDRQVIGGSDRLTPISHHECRMRTSLVSDAFAES